MVFSTWPRGKLKFAKVARSYPVTFLLAKVIQTGYQSTIINDLPLSFQVANVSI